jgi:hypothetical protein
MHADEILRQRLLLRYNERRMLYGSAIACNLRHGFSDSSLWG